jgi:hypothetical protein
LATWTSSFEKALFRSFSHFFIGSLGFGEFKFLSSCIFWLLISCQMYSWQRFSPILWAASWIWWPLVCCADAF